MEINEESFKKWLKEKYPDLKLLKSQREVISNLFNNKSILVSRCMSKTVITSLVAEYKLNNYLGG